MLTRFQMDNVASVCCRLCRTSCVGRNINEATVEMSEVYRITIKYFPAKFLDPFWGKPSAVMCLDCWRHIVEFYSFQESIFQAQRNISGLEVDNGTTDLENKMQCATADDKKCQNSQNKYKNVNKCQAGVNALDDDYFDISLSDLDEIDIQFSSDEETSSNHINSPDSKAPNPSASKLLSMPPTKDAVQCSRRDQSIEENIDNFLAKYKPKLECWICHKSSDNFKSLERHFSSHHHRGQCYVLCCDQKLYSKKQLLDHVFYQHAPSLFECEICKTHYYTEQELRKHHDKRHGYKCAECGKVFSNSEVFDLHKKKHSVCSLCKKVFDTINDLTRHKNTVHKIILSGKRKSSMSSVDNTKRISLNKRFRYKCYLCDKIFFKILHLRDHLNFHNKDNYYACPHCPYSLQYWAQLKRHMEYEHPDKCAVRHMKQLMRAEESHLMIVGNKEDNF